MSQRAAAPAVLQDALHVHLVGVCGAGMSGLATLLAEMHKQVSGSDLAPETYQDVLMGRGVQVFKGHSPAYVGQAQVVVASSAVTEDNPELVAAQRLGVPILTHSQALGQLMRGRFGIAVAGTHGKSTTTALLGFLLMRAGLDPTVLVGAEALDFGGYARRGQGEFMVVEADEFHRRFLDLEPWAAIITNIEPDHLDYYGDTDSLVRAFVEFTQRLPAGGFLVTCLDDPALASLKLRPRRIQVGLHAEAEWRAESFRPVPPGGSEFVVVDPFGGRHRARLALAGRHNASNGLAALAAANELGADLEQLLEALPHFQGTRRRFESLGEARGVAVVSDYAHHPTEIRATLESARELYAGPIWVAFQPHTTARTAYLLPQFARAFDQADHLLLLPTYRPPGREAEDSQEITMRLLAEMRHPDARLVDSMEEAAEELAHRLTPRSLALIMGAGDIGALGPMLLHRLRGSTA